MTCDMALSLQSTQNSRGVSVRSLAGMRREALPLLAERLLASRAAALVAGLPPELYSGALLAAWPPSPEPVRKQRRRTPRPEEPLSQPTAPLSPPSSSSSPGSTAPEPARDKLFTCKVCSRSFGYKHVLQNHERTHTGEKPFECAECHKRFTRDHHLKTHLRLHTGEKPYSCPHCPRHFVQVANLRRHLRVHTGERPYACARCPARFSDSNQLKAHALVHDGERAFSCGRCGARFRRRQHAAQHRCGAEAAREADGAADWCWREDWAAPPPEQTEPEDLSLPRARCSSPDSPTDLSLRSA